MPVTPTCVIAAGVVVAIAILTEANGPTTNIAYCAGYLATALVDVVAKVVVVRNLLWAEVVAGLTFIVVWHLLFLHA